MLVEATPAVFVISTSGSLPRSVTFTSTKYWNCSQSCTMLKVAVGGTQSRQSTVHCTGT